MVIGLARGGSEGDSKDHVKAIENQTKKLLKEFKHRFGSLTCRELLGCDISTKKGLAYAEMLGLFSKKCPHFVGFSAELLEDLLKEEVRIHP